MDIGSQTIGKLAIYNIYNIIDLPLLRDVLLNSIGACGLFQILNPPTRLPAIRNTSTMQRCIVKKGRNGLFRNTTVWSKTNTIMPSETLVLIVYGRNVFTICSTDIEPPDCAVIHCKSSYRSIMSVISARFLCSNPPSMKCYIGQRDDP